MSTQVNLHVRLITSDYGAALLVEEQSEALKAAVLAGMDKVLREHGLHNLFIQSVGGPEIVTLP